jgi:hypothetical protein
MQKPPQKGYVHFDKATFERLATSQPEKLESRFSVTHGLLVNLVQAHQDASSGGYTELVRLVQRSHTTPVAKARLLKHARALFRSLVNAGVMVVEKRTATMPAHVKVAEGLQRDFSLNHTLSLWLLEVLPKLDTAQPTWPLDVMSLVEAILESPDVVLWAQVNKLKGEKIAELKAQGMEYDQRMEELDKVEHPKPLGPFIYGTFDEFAAKHPWVAHENIRPKSIARELFELCATFNDYIKDYGLQRSEGVLLRYLSDAYKTLVQNVPEASRTEQLEELAAFLLTTLKVTDSSLVEEWEAMRYGRAMSIVPAPGETLHAPKKDLAKDVKALASRVRAELHQLVRLLARKEYDEAAERLPPESGLDAAALEAALAPYWAAHPSIDVTPRARQPVLTQLVENGPRRWTVRHALLDEKGEQDWFIEGEVDLTERQDVDGAIVAVRRIGT